MSNGSSSSSPSINELSPELQRAVRWMQTHSSEVAMHSLRECARRANISPSTFSRLARTLGFENFEAMKQQYQQKLQDTASYFNKAKVLQTSARKQEWLENLANSQLQNVADVFQRNKPQDFLAAARIMLQAPQVYILGSRASFGLAQHLYYLYHMVSLNGQLLNNDAGMLSDRMLQIKRGDVLVVISFEPYAKATIMAANAAHDRGVKILSITDNSLSPLVGVAKQTLYFQSQTASYFQSAIGAVALMECLTAACTIVGGQSAIHHLRVMQEHMQSQDAYW